MEAGRASEMSGNFYQTTGRHVTEDNTTHSERLDNEKFHMNLIRLYFVLGHCFDGLFSCVVHKDKDRKLNSRSAGNEIYSHFMQQIRQSCPCA
jgi:hypothetical protein